MNDSSDKDGSLLDDSEDDLLATRDKNAKKCCWKKIIYGGIRSWFRLKFVDKLNKLFES